MFAVKTVFSVFGGSYILYNVSGAPGTGKSHLCGVAMAYAICNGLVTYVTSLASRRAAEVGDEHIHRLFGISVLRLPVPELAKQAISKLENDVKRRMFLEKLELLVIEELSLIHAELWATVDLVLQLIKGNELPFGGVLIIANGDCCQLPNVSGTDIFQSSSPLFTSHFHFLEELVRMHDVYGQEVLRLLEQRPVSPEAIERICSLLLQHCKFHDTWETVDNKMMMKVFGKKTAERQALLNHQQMIEASGVPLLLSQAADEMCLTKSNMWRVADHTAKQTLNNLSREPEKQRAMFTRRFVYFTFR